MREWFDDKRNVGICGEIASFLRAWYSIWVRHMSFCQLVGELEWKAVS
jgi:hypothetical protein